MAAIRLVVLGAIVVSLCGCGHGDVAWYGSAATVEALGCEVVDALGSGDLDQLHQFRVTREEYLEWLWPEFPASRPPSNFPGDFAWSNLDAKCRKGVRRSVDRYSGDTMTFIGLEFDEPAQDYEGFRLLRGSRLVVRSVAGDEKELRILGSVVERHGGYKLLSYAD